MKSRAAVLFVATLLLGGVAVAALSLSGGPHRRVKLKVDQAGVTPVTPTELAEWILSGRRDFVVVDLRKDEAFEKAHVTGAVSCGSCHEHKEDGRRAQEGPHFIDLSKKIVIYSDNGDAQIELPLIVARNPRLHVLKGGWAAWERDILSPVTFGGETDRTQIEAKQRKDAVRAFFSGEKPSGGSVAPLPLAPVKRENAHKPATTSEGC